MFDKIKDYYDKGLWSAQRVWSVASIAHAPITYAEYEEITGLRYTGIPPEDK